MAAAAVARRGARATRREHAESPTARAFRLRNGSDGGGRGGAFVRVHNRKKMAKNC